MRGAMLRALGFAAVAAALAAAASAGELPDGGAPRLTKPPKVKKMVQPAYPQAARSSGRSSTRREGSRRA